MIHIQTKLQAAAAFLPIKDPPVKLQADENAKWEVRPCGLLVQKRSSGHGCLEAPVPSILLRVKHGANRHEICISSQATFGDLRKVLAERTGIHPQDQKILFKDKERDSAAYLDTTGVKDRSKLVVMEDPAAQAKRMLEMRRAVKMEKDVKSISMISLEVDKLAAKVSSLERTVINGGKMPDSEFLILTELLMNKLIKLDAVIADGDAKLQRRDQVKRVQKLVETLDMLKLKNEDLKSAAPTKKESKKKQLTATKWETFDPLFTSLASSTLPETIGDSSSSSLTPRFDWEIF